MSTKLPIRFLVTALLGGVPLASWSQVNIQDTFINASSSFNWAAFDGACLTAGNNTGSIPACAGNSYYSETLVGGNSGTLPDAVGSGALRFTNGRPGGYNQHGAVVSNFTFPTGSGLHVTFTTVTYRGDSGGGGGDGADGMSFYLMDGAQNPGIGAFGGSLAYSCSNSNNPHDGLVGGYLGLGIDEFGNFLNQGDNTATGYGYVPGRIGLRGAGSVAWSALNATYPTYYPSSLTSTQQQSAVYETCVTGHVWNYSSPSSPSQTSTTLPDYNVIPNAYSVLPTTLKIANESANTRGGATPITYDLKITQDGLLSFAYSYNGGAYQSVITGQNITTSNGPLPGSFRFGFAGSTGGDTNIHEILCFKATPYEQSSSSAGLNQQQTSKVQVGTQVYLAYYDPSNWTGSVTSNNLLYSSSTQAVTVNGTANWDASCVLTGVASGQTCASTGAGPSTAEAPSSRQILSWNGTQGIAFEWGSLTGTQQTTLDAGDSTPINANRLNYLRGDRSNEITSTGAGLFRARASVMGDVVDSSPIPVGPPSQGYPNVWVDNLVGSPSLPENGGTTYGAYTIAQATRENVVYVGANDGLLHGFRSGSFTASGTFVNNTATPNDGYEVMAYMPGAVVNSIHSTTAAVDYANTQYGHNFFVDAPPGSGDLFYNGGWHTWLVGGLGPGGKAIYALDVTTPTSFGESTAASIVMGEWTSSTLACTNAASCGTNLGNTYGTPQIRRLHNGMWALIFGNGLGSASGDAGIYVMTVDPSSAAKTFYYFSTNTAGSSNGISYAVPMDLDGDNIVDYIYAGDVLGNVWRFDLTSANPSQWKTSSFTTGTAPSPLFRTPSGQPITTKVIPVIHTQTGVAPRLLVDFGTGQQIPLTNSSPTTYASGAQALYGIWDWNMGSWNSASGLQYASLPAPQTVGVTNLTQQTVTGTLTSAGGNNFRQISSNVVCWQGSSQCGTNNNSYGWYLSLPSAGEQVIYNPVIQLGTFIVNTTIPPTTNTLQCSATTATGWTFAIQPSNGGSFSQSVFGDTVNSFSTYTHVSAEFTNGTGSVSIVAANGHYYLVTQTSTQSSSNTTGGGGSSGGSSGGTGGGGGGGGAPATAVPFNTQGGQGNRVTWHELR